MEQKDDSEGSRYSSRMKRCPKCSRTYAARIRKLNDGSFVDVTRTCAYCGFTDREYIRYDAKLFEMKSVKNDFTKAGEIDYKPREYVRGKYQDGMRYDKKKEEWVPRMKRRCARRISTLRESKRSMVIRVLEFLKDNVGEAYCLREIRWHVFQFERTTGLKGLMERLVSTGEVAAGWYCDDRYYGWKDR